MVWRKIKEGIEMWETPCLGTVEAKEGGRFMALCIDPSSENPYRGVARQVTERQGDVDIPGYIDKSRLVIIESEDLLHWNVVGDLQIKGFDEVIKELERENTEFIGMEDPDIVIGRDGTKHVYFTVPLRYTDRKKYDVYLGHASGKSLETLVATSPVIGPIGEGIEGFKELAYFADSKFQLAESMNVTGEKGFSAIAAARTDSPDGDWEYSHIALDPREMTYTWCAGHASPCRILPKAMVDPGKDLHVLIMNGREQTTLVNGKQLYGHFLPGLALYNPKTGQIPWVAEEPLFKDPDCTTITFASEFVPYDEKHGLLYAHPNDSFVRAYKISYDLLRRLVPGVY